MARLIRQLVDRCGLTGMTVEGAEIFRTGGGIRHTLRVGKDKHDRSVFGWTVVVEDEKYQKMLGGMQVEIWRPARERSIVDPGRLPHYRYRWPLSGEDIPDEVIQDVTQFGLPALTFVRNRRDLAHIQLSVATVERGPLWVNRQLRDVGLRIPAVVCMARDLGDTALESDALSALRRYGHRDISWVPGQRFLVSESVAMRARQIEQNVDIDLSDLY